MGFGEVGLERNEERDGAGEKWSNEGQNGAVAWGLWGKEMDFGGLE